MKRAKETGLLWLRQAEHNLDRAKRNLEDGAFSDACFMSEQTAQVAIKAFLYFNGERFINIHSVTALVKEAGQYDADFSSFIKECGILDQYYIPTRYPNALAGDVIPAEIYRKDQAEEAVKIAGAIVDLVRQKIR